jgi:CDP-diacylglycerol--glycerol-3-phosphate 3-phosphatidyltransferase
MLPSSLRVWARSLAEGLVRPLARRGVTPNAVTVVGFLFNVFTAAVLATSHLSVGGALLFLSGIFDMLDGALARVTKRQTNFGAFLDSLLDRYSEAIILLALVFVFTLHGNTPAVLLTYAVAVGSILISYARARAEGLGLDGAVGIAPRPERVLILGFGLLFNNQTTIAALIVLALLTHFTALQRLYHVWRQTHQPSPSKKASSASKHSETTTP